MKVAAPVPAPVGVPTVEVPALPARLRAYIEMTRPRVAVMVLVTVAAGVALGAGGLPGAVLCHAVFATGLVAAAASVVNQWMERDRDAEMWRTRKRPLPTGRVRPAEALAVGISLAVIGVAWLALALPSPLAAIIAASTFLLYVGVYTPLKRVTPLNTIVGAVPGALPPVIGWAAATGGVGVDGIGLFLVLFLWQVPHFLAIAWMYRADYERGGFRMLPGDDPTGRWTTIAMVAFCVALIPAGLIPVFSGTAGWSYGLGSVALALVFGWSCVRFGRRPSDRRAREVLLVSLVYLPGWLLLLLMGHAWTRGA